MRCSAIIALTLLSAATVVAAATVAPGQLAWRLGNTGPVRFTVASDRVIVTGASAPWLAGLDRATGTSLYNVTLPAPVASQNGGPWSCHQSPKSNPFMTLTSNTRIGVDAKTGAILWRRPEDESQYYFCSSKFPESYFGFGPNNGFYRVNTTSGERKLVFTLPNCSLYFEPSNNDDYVTMSCDPASLLSYRLSDGKLQFNVSLTYGPSMTQVDNFLFVDDGIFYFAYPNDSNSGDNTILLVKLNQKDGSLASSVTLENSFAPYFFPASTGYVAVQPDLYHMNVFSTRDLSGVCAANFSNHYLGWTAAYPISSSHAGDYFVMLQDRSSTSKGVPARFHSADCTVAWKGPTRCGATGGIVSGEGQGWTNGFYVSVGDCWTNGGNTETLNIDAIGA